MVNQLFTNLRNSFKFRYIQDNLLIRRALTITANGGGIRRFRYNYRSTKLQILLSIRKLSTRLMRKWLIPHVSGLCIYVDVIRYKCHIVANIIFNHLHSINL